MLFRHSAVYLLARGLPGLINFIAIVLYTRLLSVHDYGRYSLLVAGIGLFDVVFFQWLRLSLARFFPTYAKDPKPFLSTVSSVFLGVVSVLTGIALLSVLLWPDPGWKQLVALGIPLLWTQAWFELNLSLAGAQLRPMRYGLMSTIKSGVALILGLLLVLWGLGYTGAIIGLTTGMLLVGLWVLRREWQGLALEMDRTHLRNILAYGLPLTATFALGLVVSSSDRFMLAAFLGEGAVGEYAAGTELVQRSVTLLMMTVNLAGYPLLVRTLEKEGKTATKEQARTNGTFLLAVAVPGAVGMAVLSPNIAGTIIGPEFREAAEALLPLMSLAALFAGFKAYYFDLAFQLSRWTTGQFQVLVIAAVVNLILNYCWIPIVGIGGAALATTVSYFTGLVLSAFWGRKAFALPLPLLSLAQVSVASLVMTAALWPLREYRGPWFLVTQVLVGAVVYCIVGLLLNIGGSRETVMKRLYNYRLTDNQ